MVNVPNVMLNSGHPMPILGLGTWGVSIEFVWNYLSKQLFDYFIGPSPTRFLLGVLRIFGIFPYSLLHNYN